MSKLYILCGMPGSGKSHWAETHKEGLNAVVHSSDAIRAELGNVNDQSKNELVFKILHQRIKDDLKAGKNVIYDATNLSRKNRVHFIKNELRNIPCEKICVLFATPWEMCCARNFARDRQVPVEVLVRMYKNFETPTIYDGFDDVQIVWADYSDMSGFEYDINADMEKWKKISHNNPHHTLSIGDHMKAAREYCDNLDKAKHNPHLVWAVSMHDIGKPCTKSFIDSKGNVCDTAHFYEHQNVGAYLALFYLREIGVPDEDIIYISLLINLHMRPFLAYKHSDKAEAKDRRLFGDKIVDEVLILHECDKAAH